MNSDSVPSGNEHDVEALLRRIPESWADYDPDTLTETESQTLTLLVLAGMVERRTQLRLRMFDHQLPVEATITFTGEYGLVEAIEHLIGGVFEQWQAGFVKRRQGAAKEAPAFHCQRIGAENWRLTSQGVLARQDLGQDKRRKVFDFVLRQSTLQWRPPVRGAGSLVRFETREASAAPGSVAISNWPEGAAAFAKVFEMLAQQLAGQQAAATVQAAPSPAPSPPIPRIVVSLDPPQVVLDGAAYALTPDGAAFLQTLVEANGDWVAGSSIPDIRADRVKGRLPAPIRDLIEASTGKGYRLKLA